MNMSKLESNAQGYYYFVYAELQKLAPEGERLSMGSVELDEIDQVIRMVDEVTSDPPRFFTTT